jgi:quercetin dioxygenase-like cupin family protein
MKRTVTIMSIADVPLHVPTGLGREGSSASKPFPLDSGIPGVRLEFTWRRYDKGYGTPRHTHIFDQYRYNMSGKRMIKDGFLEAGEVAFYPEGVYYGPQMQEEECTGLGLQFQGLTGVRYLTHKELGDARKALSAEGASFKGGIYTKIMPDGRKINKDSHVACTEYVTGEKVEFPKARFDKPIVMKPQGHPWIGDRKCEGVAHKRLGTFGGSGIRLMKLEPGAKIPAQHMEDAEIRYVTDGSIEYDGKTWQGGKTQDAGTYMYVPHNSDVGEITTKTGATFYIIELPMLADIEAQRMQLNQKVATSPEMASAT